MKEITPGSGLFEVEEQMPCLPRQIRWQQYLLPSTLGRAETEEMAARLIEYSVNAGQWVGVSWDLILGKIKEDLKNFDKANVELRRGKSDSKELLPPFSCIFFHGSSAVQSGMVDLIQEGFVRFVEQPNPDKTVFFPTLKMIRKIAVAQGVIAA